MIGLRRFVGIEAVRFFAAFFVLRVRFMPIS